MGHVGRIVLFETAKQGSRHTPQERRRRSPPSLALSRPSSPPLKLLEYPSSVFGGRTSRSILPVSKNHSTHKKLRRNSCSRSPDHPTWEPTAQATHLRVRYPPPLSRQIEPPPFRSELLSTINQDGFIRQGEPASSSIPTSKRSVPSRPDSDKESSQKYGALCSRSSCDPGFNLD